MKIILTGGAGFIGSCMLSKLNSESITDITVVDHLDSPEKEHNLKGKKIKEYIEKKDFLDAITQSRFKDKVDFIVHMGACTSTTETDADYLMKNNYLYSRKLAEWALSKGVQFIYASSAATYGSGEFGYSDQNENTLRLKPLNLYGYSKHVFDLWVIENGLSDKVAGFKFFNVFGPNEYHKEDMRSLIAKSFEQVVKTGKLKLFKSYKKEFSDGEQKRDFVYVKDAVSVVWDFIKSPQKKGIFNLGTGIARSWNDLAKGIFLALGLEPKIEYFDMPEAMRDKYQYFTQADLKKLRSVGINHEFMSLEDSIKDYITYLKGHIHL